MADAPFVDIQDTRRVLNRTPTISLEDGMASYLNHLRNLEKTS